MITIKLDLFKLKHSVTKMKNGNDTLDCIVLPIEMNRLYKGEKGIYLDLIAFEIKERKEGNKDTHLIKQSLSKEDRETMPEEEQRSMPIIGNMRMWEAVENNSMELKPVEDDPASDLPFDNPDPEF